MLDTHFFYIYRASATKCFETSRIFRYGLPRYNLSKGQNTKARGGWAIYDEVPKSINKNTNVSLSLVSYGASLAQNLNL